MIRSRRWAVLFTVFCTSCILFLTDSVCHAITTEQKAWEMFDTGAKSKHLSERTAAIRALGLMKDNARARELAETALTDKCPAVRTAAATALGQMHAMESIAKLQKLLGDKRMGVVLAAANALRELKDERAADAIYLDVLTGERKGDGLIRQQLDTLRDPSELARIGFETGIGYVPFAGIGWDAWRYTHKKNPHPARAIAATMLTHDPHPATARALVRVALSDKDWIVRAAAVEAIAERGDPTLADKILLSIYDGNIHVRYTAAAALIRLTRPRNAEPHEEEAKAALK
ncbi:MAG TPA: HEAT repeat domain-containing protein [Candidatus Sulfotelmatobacter sp.]